MGQPCDFLATSLTLNSKGGPTINFKDAASLRALTHALLQRDFRLNVQLPEDRLCPAIPGRLDYVLYLQDLVQAHRAAMQACDEPAVDTIHGLDIGTGASAVYPLLFTRVEPTINMLGTDIDDASLESAERNINVNQLENQVAALKVQQDAPFFEAALDLVPHFEFTMCNPPFYTSAEEMEQLANEKEFGPYAVCTGSPAEMVTEGGEATFVCRMVQESRAAASRIDWFSSLLGKASSVIKVVQELQATQCSNYAVVEFVQGHTQRWAIAWSWTEYRLPDSIARQLPPGPLTRSLPLPNTLSYVCPASLTLDEARSTMRADLHELDIVMRDVPDSGDFQLRASQMGWTRAARRAKARGEASTAEAVSLICMVSLHELEEQEEEKPTEFKCTWMKGSNRHAFESLFSYLVRRLQLAATAGVQGKSADTSMQ